MTIDITSRRIVAGVDGSPSSVQAALWAASEAAQRHEPMRLVHAVDQRGLAFGPLLAPSYFDVLQADGRQILADVEVQIRRLHPGLALETTLHNAAAVPALIEESRNALLVVVGSRGMGGFEHILVGSTAVGIVAYGHSPVAVIRGQGLTEAPSTRGPVVVGVDGSTTSDAAIATAFDEASWRATDLVAVHAQPWLKGFLHPPQYEWELNDPEREVLAERLAGWQEKFPDVRVRRMVSTHSPVAGLLESAVDAQLLIVGSRGHGGFTGMVLGSTSQALIYHAPCPVLVVRPDHAR